MQRNSLRADAERYSQAANSLYCTVAACLLTGSLWAVAGGGGGRVRGRDSGGRVRQQHATPQPPGPPRVSGTTLAVPGLPLNHLDHPATTETETSLRPSRPPYDYLDHHATTK